MTRPKKILILVLALFAVALSAFAFALSRNSPCGPAPALAAGAERMKAVVRRCYGPAEVLRLEDIEKPTPKDDEVLVKVRAVAVNPLDWHYMTGTPYVMRIDSGFGRPKSERLGVDFAGTVEAVGKSVTQFKPGDEVFGAKNGAFAEYVTVRESRGIVLKPAHISFEQAASAPVAAITALQGLRDKGRIRPGQKVLINGASGGVGTFAVQIAKSLGAEVTGVCSTRNVEMVRAIGADHVIDYTREDFTSSGQRYDVIFDNVGNHPLLAYRRVMTPEGVYVMVGGPKKNKWLGPLLNAVKAPLLAPFVSQEFAVLLAELTKEDLSVLGDLMAGGKVKPVIDRRYTLRETPEALRYLETQRARGKVVITLDDGDEA
jgi:NADPH:quinone reductase-like Zn-dependent oxidoreductase